MVMLYDHRGDRIDAGQPARGWYHTSAERRWAASETNRLNQHLWSTNGGNIESINAQLNGKLNKIRQRCVYETANNAIISGMVARHQVDLIGRQGPTLSIVPKNPGRLSDQQMTAVERFARALEGVWTQWAAAPDVTGQLSMADVLRQDVQLLHASGEFLTQKTRAEDGRQGESPIRLRINQINPARLVTQFGGRPAQSGEHFMGIDVNRFGRPVRYWVEDRDPAGLSISIKPRELRAQNIIHGFRVDEPGQLRGLPWLTPALLVAAELRDFDAEVLNAARLAAYFGVIMESNSDKLEPIEVNDSTTFEPGQIVHAPPGWSPKQMQAEQPSTNYVEYRKEKHGDLGRPINMPRMIARQDSSGMNFSSARFDAQGYDKANDEKQGWLERVKLNPLLREVEMEARDLTGPPPQGVELEARWSWPGNTHRAVDPNKEAQAAERRLKARLSTYQDELASEGKSLADHLQQLKREARMLKDELGEGLPSPDQNTRDTIEELFQKSIEEYMAEQE